MEEQYNPEKLKEIATTVAGVILKQKMSDTNPLGRECKLEFVSVDNFRNQVSNPNKKIINTSVGIWFQLKIKHWQQSMTVKVRFFFVIPRSVQGLRFEEGHKILGHCILDCACLFSL